MKRTKIAVVGAGTFGRQHARVLSSLPAAELVAVVDTDADRAQSVAGEFGCRPMTDYRLLAGLAEAAVVAAPTGIHAEIGCALLESGLDLLVEKPVAHNLQAADQLIATARRCRRILQVGHLERFNPVVEAAYEVASLPLFFEVHRMSPFSPRSLDIDVILDLMIHDLEIILDMVHSPIARLEATGIPILSPKADIGSVRLVFENGCVANLTASRISTERIRKLRFFQPRQYVSLDFTRQDGVIHMVGESNQIRSHPITVEKGEPLVRQAQAFLDVVRSRGAPRVPGEAARGALEVGLRIVEEMERHSRIVAATMAGEQR